MWSQRVESKGRGKRGENISKVKQTLENEVRKYFQQINQENDEKEMIFLKNYFHEKYFPH